MLAYQIQPNLQMSTQVHREKDLQITQLILVMQEMLLQIQLLGKDSMASYLTIQSHYSGFELEMWLMEQWHLLEFHNQSYELKLNLMQYQDYQLHYKMIIYLTPKSPLQAEHFQ